MISYRAKLWTGVSAALLLTTAGCGKPAEKAVVASSAPAQAVGEGGEGGSEGGGEAGAQAAFAGIPNESKPALRLAQIKGFVLIAMKQKDGPEAGGVLLGQGLLETLDKNPAVFKAAGVDEALLRKAAQTGSQGDLKAALDSLDAAQAKAGGDPLAVVKGMVDIATGLYTEAVKPGSTDPIDYQHSLGAALAAQDILKKHQDDARARAAAPEMAKFVGLWPQLTAPEKPTPAPDLAAQASRLELALS